MKKFIKKLLKRIVFRLRGDYTTDELVSRGMKVGKNFSRGQDVVLDPIGCWMLEIGDNVTIALHSIILCHDASTKKFLGYSKIGRVKIGDNVFIGANSVILPGVEIGSNVVIGANSTVTHDIPEGSVAMGSPARVVCTTKDYIAKQKKLMDERPCFGAEYTFQNGASLEKRMEVKKALGDKMGFID